MACNQNREIAEVSEGSVTGYSLSFFRNLLATVPADDNVTLSPYSAGVALSMLAEGADGQTLAELNKALASCRFRESDIESGELQAEDAVIVRSANSLWTNSSYPVKSAYSELLSKEYGATSQALDFSLKSSKDAINAWAREHTEGKIDNVVNELSPQMVAILANALYFKGAWHRPFDVHRTAQRTFHGTRGDRDVD
ncbi:MAG: serpin family protein, partial [Candidatus Cryptobacteroides sp.]